MKIPDCSTILPEKLHKIETRNHIVRKNFLTVEEIENIRYYYEKIKAPTMYFLYLKTLYKIDRHARYGLQ